MCRGGSGVRHARAHGAGPGGRAVGRAGGAAGNGCRVRTANVRSRAGPVERPVKRMIGVPASVAKECLKQRSVPSRLSECELVRAVRLGTQRARSPGRMPPPPIKAAAKGGKRKKAPPPRKKGPPGPSPTAKRGGGPPPPPKRGPPAPPVPTSVVSAARENDAHLASHARLLSSTAFAIVFLTFEFALAHHSSAQIRQQHQRCSLHGRSAWVALHRHNGHLLRSCTCSLSRCCGLHHQAGQRRTPRLLQPGVVWRERERIDQYPYAACSMHGPALRCVAVEHLPKSVAARMLRTGILAARHHRRNHRGSLGTGCSLWLGLRRWCALLARQGRKRLLASGRRSGACSRRLGALRNGGR